MHSTVRLAVLVLILPYLSPASMTAQVTDPAPAFDVASIRPSPPSTDGHHHIYSSPNESHFRTGNLSTKDLIQFAYDMPVSQILGGPPWLDTVFFDIDAKSDPAADDRMHGLTSEAGKLQKRLMVQALLADRFGLKAHMETRELPNYTLVVANPKTGPNLHLTHANGTTIDTGNEHIHVMGGGDNTVPLLARQLAVLLGRPVLDDTGILGRYDIRLRWTPDSVATPPPDAPPGIFTAIQEQLGLKLESTKGPVPVLVIDHIDQPTPI